VISKVILKSAFSNYGCPKQVVEKTQYLRIIGGRYQKGKLYPIWGRKAFTS